MKRKTQRLIKKAQNAMFALATVLAVLGAFVTNVSANSPPANVDTTNMDTLVSLVFWAVRLVILAVGGIPGLVKVVQGQTDENPRDRNAGISGLVVTGIIFAGSFGLEALFK